MFVKKLVEKASLKKPGGNLDGLKCDEVNPRLVFHYGIPSGSILLAYDSIQKILAISTVDGRIKLYGKDNTQALLESTETVPSKFLQFIENQGILLNVNANNHIEVWDIDRKLLSHVHVHKEEVTSFTVMQRNAYIYVGDSVGNVSVLKLDQETCSIVQMKYNIPLLASHGNTTEVAGDTTVVCILPQPTAESKRVLIIYRDGFITLWAIRESKAIFTTGGIMLPSVCHETKKVTAACWACPYGSKVVVGYSNGDIFIWNVPPSADSKTELAPDKELFTTQSAPICKLNLGYKLDKIPIESLKWAYADGKASRLYVMGVSDLSANSLQVIIMNEHTESRTIKLVLHPPEPCVEMEIISSSNEQSKNKQDSLLLLGKSGHIYAYDDCLIEKYLLLLCQSRSPPSLPKEVMVKLPFPDSSITIAKFITNNSYLLCSADEDGIMVTKNIPPLLPFETRQKDGTQWNSAHFSGFSKIKNLYITGHSNGAINFWDVSCPFLLPVISLTQQSEDDLSLSGIALTALYFDGNSQLLVSGDQSGMVRVFKLKPEPFTTGSSFMSLQGSSKKGSHHVIHSVKLVKVNGAVLSININRSLRYLAVGSEQGYVSVIDMEGPNLLYQKHIASELCTGVISLQFEACCFHGFEKNVLVVATKDSSVLALESDTGNTISSSMVCPKKPSRALFMQILDGQDTAGRGSNKLEGPDLSKGHSIDDVMPKQLLLLLCSEKAVYVYSLSHVVQGIKKVHYKKKFQSSCCWASIFYTPDNAGLILLFSSGKIDIRSVPELSLLKETSIRGFTFSTPKLNSISESSVCSSLDGELIMVNGDQEIFSVSVLLEKQMYRHLDSVSQVFKKGLIVAEQGLISAPVIHKEKKKGIFSSVIKDIKGSKAKHGPDTEAEDARESVEELYMIFSVDNFPSHAENRENLAMDEDEIDLDIDDINIEDPVEKPKGHPMMAVLNKQKLSSKFQALKGKLKQMKVKNEKNPANEEPQDEKAGAVAQIKRKYGFTLSGESSDAKMAESKLKENLRKLQGISMKTTEMQDTAQSFSSMAKEVLRYAEHDRRLS
uniref:Lethal giant larvae (Lgl)-like C-terminal domain-containing protein n=2 Tax=Davidia involucrata TaxID=16924 RepID=A0A5B7B5H0_DAVIN